MAIKFEKNAYVNLKVDASGGWFVCEQSCDDAVQWYVLKDLGLKSSIISYRKSTKKLDRFTTNVVSKRSSSV